MERYEENNESTTYAALLGWHGLIFGTIPIVFGIYDNNKAAMITDGIVLIAGVILLTIGKSMERGENK